MYVYLQNLNILYFNLQLLAINLSGALAIFGWTTLISGGIFGVLKLVGMLRVSPELERKGRLFHSFLGGPTSLLTVNYLKVANCRILQFLCR